MITSGIQYHASRVDWSDANEETQTLTQALVNGLREKGYLANYMTCVTAVYANVTVVARNYDPIRYKEVGDLVSYFLSLQDSNHKAFFVLRVYVKDNNLHIRCGSLDLDIINAMICLEHNPWYSKNLPLTFTK